MTIKERAEKWAELARKSPIQKPTHGTCCTCQKCGQGHDDCQCDEVALRADAYEEAAKDLLDGAVEGFMPWHEEHGPMLLSGAVEGPYEHYIINQSRKGAGVRDDHAKKGWRIVPVKIIRGSKDE